MNTIIFIYLYEHIHIQTNIMFTIIHLHEYIYIQIYAYKYTSSANSGLSYFLNSYMIVNTDIYHVYDCKYITYIYRFRHISYLQSLIEININMHINKHTNINMKTPRLIQDFLISITYMSMNKDIYTSCMYKYEYVYRHISCIQNKYTSVYTY